MDVFMLSVLPTGWMLVDFTKMEIQEGPLERRDEYFRSPCVSTVMSDWESSTPHLSCYLDSVAGILCLLLLTTVDIHSSG